MKVEDEIKSLKQELDKLINEVFRSLEIISLGNRIKTGLDADILLNGKSIIGYLGISKMNFDMNPECEYGTIKITCCKIDNELLFNKESNKIEEYIITITSPVKKIHIDYKGLSLISDNTIINTKIVRNGKDITKELSVSDISTTIGDADTITEMEITIA